MRELTALICDCCGGHIDEKTLKCQSCGTQYRSDASGRLEIINSDRPIRFLHQSVIIPRFMVETDTEKAMEYGLHQLAERLAERIMPLCEWVEEYSPADQSYYLHMKIGIAEPKKDLWREIRSHYYGL